MAWHLVSELPTVKGDSCRLFHSGSGQMHRFYMVHVFADQLRKWITNNRPKVLVVERPIHRQEKPKELDLNCTSIDQSKSTFQKSNGGFLRFADFRFDREAINRCLVFR